MVAFSDPGPKQAQHALIALPKRYIAVSRPWAKLVMTNRLNAILSLLKRYSIILLPDPVVSYD